MANLGAVPVDYTSPVGQARALMGDTDASNTTTDSGTGLSTGEYVWFGDDELGAFLAMNNGDPRRAAVAALRLVALTPALKLKKWTSADLAVDGPSITKALSDLIDSIEEGIAATDAAYGYFSIDAPCLPKPWWEWDAPNAPAGPPFLVPGFPYDGLMP